MNVIQFGDGIPGFQELINLHENQIQKTKFTQLLCSSFWAQLKDKLIPKHEAEKKISIFLMHTSVKQDFRAFY
jgi:hypothetical protein